MSNNQENQKNKKDEHVILQCPYCEEFILIYKKEFNCKIFRHAYYKSNNQQIDPHSSKEVCDNLIKEMAIGTSFLCTNSKCLWFAQITLYNNNVSNIDNYILNCKNVTICSKLTKNNSSLNYCVSNIQQ